MGLEDLVPDDVSNEWIARIKYKGQEIDVTIPYPHTEYIAKIAYEGEDTSEDMVTTFENNVNYFTPDGWDRITSKQGLTKEAVKTIFSKLIETANDKNKIISIKQLKIYKTEEVRKSQWD